MEKNKINNTRKPYIIKKEVKVTIFFITSFSEEKINVVIINLHQFNVTYLIMTLIQSTNMICSRTLLQIMW